MIYLETNQVPSGATHCAFPESDHDPIFYRVVDGELEIYGIVVKKWLKSKHQPDHIKTLHELSV